MSQAGPSTSASLLIATTAASSASARDADRRRDDLLLRERDDERREVERERHDPQERHAREIGGHELGGAEQQARRREREREPDETLAPHRLRTARGALRRDAGELPRRSAPRGRPGSIATSSDIVTPGGAGVASMRGGCFLRSAVIAQITTRIA